MGFSSWLDEATPDRREVTVCLDRRLVSELVKAKDELEEARGAAAGMLGADTKPLVARVTEIEDQVREKSRTMVFEGLGWGRWRDLIAKHPPAADQHETFSRAVQLGFMPHAIENITYNAETFVPAVIAASCVDPGMTVAQARELLQRSPAGIIERVWAAVLDANLSGGNDPFVPPASAG